jgi:hypothetical protein
VLYGLSPYMTLIDLILKGLNNVVIIVCLQLIASVTLFFIIQKLKRHDMQLNHLSWVTSCEVEM